MNTAWLYEPFALLETAYVGLAVGALWLQPIAKPSRPIENLANPFLHPWYATFHCTHPPIPDRIRYIQGIDAGESRDDSGVAASGAD